MFLLVKRKREDYRSSSEKSSQKTTNQDTHTPKDAKSHSKSEDESKFQTETNNVDISMIQPNETETSLSSKRN